MSPGVVGYPQSSWGVPLVRYPTTNAGGPASTAHLYGGYQPNSHVSF